jgi:hypothetical protein
MTGWIKLPRQLIAKGHMRMPELAFKIWIYCLLRASPFPNGNLQVGELELSYKEIQQLSPPDKTISKSTIANNLRYLKENCYLEIKARPFTQLKVKINNWHWYQPGVNSYNVTNHKNCLLLDPPAGTTTVPGQYADSTRASTPAVPDEYIESTRVSTHTVPVDSSGPCNTKASSEHKNKVKNTKELVNNITPLSPLKQGENLTEYIKKQFPRYSNTQCATINNYWRTVINTTNGQAVGNIIPQSMNQWEQFNVDVVMRALNIHLEKHHDKRANYTVGIMRRLQQELESGVSKGGSTHGPLTTSAESLEEQYRPSRYSHLVRR